MSRWPFLDSIGRRQWRCFHCDETFTDRAKAAEHFGRFEDCIPICAVGASRYRELESQLAAFHSESDPSTKTWYELGAKHAGELRREEERGYAKGLKDGRLHPPEGWQLVPIEPTREMGLPRLQWEHLLAKAPKFQDES